MRTDKSKKYRDAFAVVLRRQRTALKITQEELADRAGTAVRYIGHLEGGTRQPSISTFCSLAYALETTPADFMRTLQDTLLASSKKE